MHNIPNWFVMFLMLGSAAIAQEAPPKSENKPAEGLESLIEGLTQLGIAVVDTHLDHLAEPETAAKMAALDKTYYDAFVAQGFTKNQALLLTPGVVHAPDQHPGHEQLYNYLVKPETAKKVTAFYKNYYDALVKQGFSREEAFEFLRQVGPPVAKKERN